jgi:hypothetical protein
MKLKAAFFTMALLGVLLAAEPAFAVSATCNNIPCPYGGNFGVDGNSPQWNLQASATVSLAAGSVSNVTFNGQVICPNNDVNNVTGKCTSNFYMMVYQLNPYTPPPGGGSKLTISFPSLVGFNINGTFNSGNANDYGVLSCGSGVSLLTARCTNLNFTQIDALGPSATSLNGGGNVSFSLNNPPPIGFSFFVVVTNPNFNGLVPISVQIDPRPQAANLVYLPHVPSGAGYVTRITIFNTAPATSAIGQINFIDQNGNLLKFRNFAITPGGAFNVQTDEADRPGPLSVSWAIIGSDQPVQANLFFEFAPSGLPAAINTVGFNASGPLSDFTFPVLLAAQPQGATIGRTMGVAFANPNNFTVTIKIKVLDNQGNIVAQTGGAGCPADITLAAFAQTGIETKGFFGACPGYPNPPFNPGFFGTMVAAASAQISSIALQDSFGPFSATPVVAGRAK